MQTKQPHDEYEQSTKRLIWILVILVFLIVGFVGYQLYFANPHEGKKLTSGDLNPKTTIVEKGNQEKPVETKKLEDTKISLVDYTVYDFDDIPFAFVIAKLHVQASQPTNISLSHFTTSEGIVLSSTSDYVKQLEEHSYFLGRQNVWFSLVNNDLSYDANIFIPLKGKGTSSIRVTSDLDGVSEMVFDLSTVKGEKKMLTYEAQDVITDGKSYEMVVSKAFDITGEMLYTTVNGEEEPYYLPSTTKVYEFEIQAVSLFGDEVVIESAQYVPNGINEVFDAMASDVHSLKDSNILNKSIKEKDQGYLFFYAFNPDEAPITYNGILKLKLKGQDTPVEVTVNLN